MFSVIVLAAGCGSRFKSSKSKVLHEIGGLPIIYHIINGFSGVSVDEIYLVASKEMLSDDFGKEINVVEQKEKLGTANAVLAVDLDKINSQYIFVLYGDTPFLSGKTINKCISKMQSEDVDCVIISSESQEKNDYGRLAFDADSNVACIVEATDTVNNNFLLSGFCNNGMMFKTDVLRQNITKIVKNQIKAEYLLTDIVSILYSSGYKSSFIVAPEEETIGINTRFDLIVAERIFQETYRRKVIDGGVTLLDPSTTYFSYDTVIESDVIVYPNVHFLPNVHVSSGATIYGNSVLEGCRVHFGATVGPFARIRRDSVIMENAKIGNFVEVKNSVIAANVKACHLSYIGDSLVGAGSNIGAGVITCNYDGITKSKTEIGESVFVGSNSSLIAPVKIGNGAIIGAGSTITKDVESEDLTIARSKQVNITNGANKYRKKKCAE